MVEVLLHPNFRFTPQADRYDVAVLELDRTASYKDNIKPICLPQKDAAFVGRVAYVAGWGALQAGEYAIIISIFSFFFLQEDFSRSVGQQAD